MCDSQNVPLIPVDWTLGFAKLLLLLLLLLPRLSLRFDRSGFFGCGSWPSPSSSDPLFLFFMSFKKSLALLIDFCCGSVEQMNKKQLVVKRNGVFSLS